jgi:branched-chain amino acid transport system permease protein
MAGGYCLYLIYVALGWPYAVGVLATMILMGIFGAVFEVVAIRPVIHKPWQTQVVVTLGASVLLLNGAAVLFGTFPREAPTVLSADTVTVGSVTVAWQEIVDLIVALIAFVVLWHMIRATRFGKAMRAVSQNREACVACGINVQTVGMVTFAIGAALAGLAAALTVPMENIAPDTGYLLAFKAFAVVIMGGFGGVSGVLPAALLLGIAESLTAQYISTEYVDAVSFAVMLLVLVFRPQGIFGQRERIA